MMESRTFQVQDDLQIRRFIHNFWDYYCELENDFLVTRKYVSFSELNYSTFSLEYLKLFQAVCSEIDVLGKTIASTVDINFKPKDKQNNIYKWWHAIQDLPLINSSSKNFILSDSTCIFLNEMNLTPWNSFKTERRLDKRGRNYIRAVDRSVPSWWTAYNNVKHSRISLNDNQNDDINFAKANLKNLINAFAGLYLLEIFYLSLLSTVEYSREFSKKSCLFRLSQLD